MDKWDYNFLYHPYKWSFWPLLISLLTRPTFFRECFLSLLWMSVLIGDIWDHRKFLPKSNTFVWNVAGGILTASTAINMFILTVDYISIHNILKLEW